jgi:very-short-patch-repair endonuclease
LKKHNITFKDYVKIHIEDFKPLWKICPVCNENVTNKNTCSKKCGYILRSQVNEGVNVWERMSEDTRKKASKKLSEKAFVNGQGRNIWSEMSETTKKIAKDKLSKRAKEKIGKLNPMYGNMWTEEMIKKMIRRRKVNNLEKMMENFLIEYKISYIKQYYQKWNDRRYFYDFCITDTNILIETDGDYWHGGPGVTKYHKSLDDNKKTDAHKNQIAKERGFTLLRFWESEIKSDFELVKEKILRN